MTVRMRHGPPERRSEGTGWGERGRTASLVCIGAALIGCDSGSQVETIDWRGLEQRLTVLEQENTQLKTEL